MHAEKVQSAAPVADASAFEKLRTGMVNARKAWTKRQPLAVVIHKLRLVYYPVPKVASSSLRRYFLMHALAEDRDDIATLPQEAIHQEFVYPTLPRRKAAALEGYTSLAVVRNPFDRIWSCYQDKVAGQAKANGKLHPGLQRYNKLTGRVIFSPEMSFLEFCRTISNIPDFLADEHFRSQHRLVPADRSAFQVDYLVRQEELDARMTEICERLGLPAWQSERVNAVRSPRQSGGGFTEEIVELLWRRYTRDLRLTGYCSPGV